MVHPGIWSWMLCMRSWIQSRVWCLDVVQHPWVYLSCMLPMSDVFGIMNRWAGLSWIWSVVGHGYNLDQTWMGLGHILRQPGKTGGTCGMRAKQELPANDLILLETCHSPLVRSLAICPPVWCPCTVPGCWWFWYLLSKRVADEGASRSASIPSACWGCLQNSLYLWYGRMQGWLPRCSGRTEHCVACGVWNVGWWNCLQPACYLQTCMPSS